MAKDREEIIEDLSYKYDLSVEEIEDIINHQFKFVTTIMKKGDFDTVRLPYFGKFIVNKNRVKHINRLKNEKDIKKI
jgi:nucleoid DNA-binding protein